MFAKVFTQIFDSSIVEMPETRFTFMDFLVLADVNGVVDMTHEAIARRTNRPLELIRKTVLELEQPDERSRTKMLNGARIRRLDKHRDWGWEIVNYRYFRQLASEEQRREKTKRRTQRYRKALDTKVGDAAVTHSDAHVTLGDDLPSASASSFPSGFQEEWEAFKKHRAAIRHPMTARAEELIQKTLLERPADAVAGLQCAIKNNWRGFEWPWFDSQKQPRNNGAKPWQSAAERKQAEIDEANRKYREKKQAEAAKNGQGS